MSLRGMTWDHPRAYRPLEAFAESVPAAGTVVWDRQSLADFEARSLTELAADHDLLVIDHPNLGSAIASDTLIALDELFTEEELRAWATASVGPTWTSYSVQGRQWALPIDAATQVSVATHGLRAGLPRDWRQVAELASSRPTALCLGGPHALLSLLAMCAGRPPAPGSLVEAATAHEALGTLAEVWRHVDPEVSLGDPIDVHEAIARARVDYCPLAYGYASYAVPADDARGLAWGAAPSSATSAPGSVLGGTGLAFSSRSGADRDEIRTWVRAYVAPVVQEQLVPAHSGQPAHLSAWLSPEVDAAWGGYYSATRSTLEASWIRPRPVGWAAFQLEASELVRAAVAGRMPHVHAVTEINHGFSRLEPETTTAEARA